MIKFLNRFLIGSLINMTSVAYYATPYDILSRLQMIPRAMMGVLFPAMAVAYSADKSRLKQLYSQSSRILLAIMLPISLVLFLFSSDMLTIG